MVVSRNPARGLGPDVEQGFLDLLNTHQHAVRRIARAYAGSPADRQDLFQEIVYQLWRAYPSYRGEASAFTWLYRVALNTAITSMRRRTRGPAVVPLESADERWTAAVEARTPEAARLHRAIRELGDVDRALIMCYLDDLSYREIAAVLGLSENNVGVRLTRIKAKLQRLVAETE
jgi:RNA polymerase sigma-70 factor (ECF subfamily)